MIKEEFFQSTTDLDKISQVQSKYKYFDTKIIEIEIGDVPDPDKDPWIAIVKGQDIAFHMTAQFLQSFCALLGIPYAYSQHIPFDLFKTNVDRLKPLRDCAVKICLRDDTLVNIYAYGEDKDGKQTKFRPLDTSNLLEYFNGDKYRLRNCVVGDFGAMVDVICDDLGKVNLIDSKDVAQLGYRVVNPFTMTGDKLSMSLIAELDSCKNGLGLPFKLGTVKTKLTKEIGSEDADYFDDFTNRINAFIAKTYSLESIKEALTDLENCKIKFRFLRAVFSKLRKTDDGMFEKVTGIRDWKSEKDFFMKKFEDDEAEDSMYEFYKVVNEATNFAQGLDILTQLSVEGWIASVIKMNQRQYKLYSEKK